MWGTTRLAERQYKQTQYFNPRPPCGGRQGKVTARREYERFQSTSPVWGTTLAVLFVYLYLAISIHVPRVGDDNAAHGVYGILSISIHVPRVGDDGNSSTAYIPCTQFQSTSPVWGTTKEYNDIISSLDISIHVPRVGDDVQPAGLEWIWGYFNPRPPCGGRPQAVRKQTAREPFQSTSPVWGTTGATTPYSVIR